MHLRIIITNTPSPSPSHICGTSLIWLVFIYHPTLSHGYKSFYLLLSKLLPCKIIAAFQLFPAHTVKRRPPHPHPTGFLLKEFSFHGQLSFLHLEETEPWHNYVSWLFSRFAGGLDLILKHYFYLTLFAWITSSDCVEVLLKKKSWGWGENGALCPVAVSSAHHLLYQYCALCNRKACTGPSIFLQTGLISLKFFYRFFWTLDQKMLCLFALQSPKVYQGFKRGVLSFSLYTYKGMTSIFTWSCVCFFLLYFLIPIGCNRINPTLSQLHFSSGELASCFPSTRWGFFFRCGCLFVFFRQGIFGLCGELSLIRT